MGNDEKIVLNYMNILTRLSNDLKLQLISRLSESIKLPESQQENKDDWKELFGVWSEVNDIDAEQIREARFSGREVPNFDS